MKKLNNKVEALILSGVSMSGSYDPDESFHYFEEQLTIEQAIYSRAFLAWVHEQKLKFGSGNINEVYTQFIQSDAFTAVEAEYKQKASAIESNMEVKVTELKPRQK